MGGGWVFAYGSLMWSPEMPVAETVTARLDGFARSFCLLSVRHRGTPETPGLVLGLEETAGAHCTGLAFHVGAADWGASLAALRERELVTAAYREQVVPLALADGRRVEAMAYVMRLDHAQHVSGLSLDQQAEIIARARGGRGSNADYLFSTVAQLDRLGMPDADLGRLADRVRVLLAGAGAA